MVKTINKTEPYSAPLCKMHGFVSRTMFALSVNGETQPYSAHDEALENYQTSNEGDL